MSRRRFHVGRVAPLCSPKHIINHSDQLEKVRHRNGDTADIIEVILEMDADSARWINTGAAECLRGQTVYETLRNVWRFVKHNITYRADQPGHERVKSPGALFASGKGDCKSLSIAEGALLRALGIRYKYRFTAYRPGDYTHVYVVAQTPDGWLPLDAVYSAPFEEERYYKKRDIAPASAAMNGLGKAPPQTATNWTGIGLLALLIFFVK